jgi:hypothetical protein
MRSCIGGVQQLPRVLSFRPFAASQNQFTALIREEHKRLGVSFREAGIRLD